MNYLVPCPSCARHVRQSEAACPFCSVELALGHLSPPVLPRLRLGRAATFAFGATLVGATSLVACGGDSQTSKPGSGGANSKGGTSAAGSSAAGTAGAGGNSAGGSSAGVGGNSNGGNSNGGNSAGTFSGMGGNIAQPYGVPPFGGFGATYGTPPPGGNTGFGGSTSTSGASGEANGGTAGSGGPTPLYGAPPQQ